jgi:hypothetical protein
VDVWVGCDSWPLCGRSVINNWAWLLLGRILGCEVTVLRMKDWEERVGAPVVPMVGFGRPRNIASSVVGGFRYFSFITNVVGGAINLFLQVCFFIFWYCGLNSEPYGLYT